MRVHLLIIDPQKDFMDTSMAALPVPGATADMQRLAAMVDRIGHKLRDIHVTMDSHHIMDYRHPGAWKNQNGDHPTPITKGGNLISADDIENGIWVPYGANAKPRALGGKTVKQFMVECAAARESKGVPGLEIWPEHCIIGTDGWSIETNLRDALSRWERSEHSSLDIVAKGTNVYTEHYGGLCAEVTIAADSSTGFNSGLLNTMAQADLIPVAGEASSHCVLETLAQIANYVGEEQIKKFVLLTDAMSPVPQPPGGPDFPAIAAAFMKDMAARGMQQSTTADFLS